MQDPRRRPDDDERLDDEEGEPQQRTTRRQTDRDMWAAVESQIDEIMREEEDDPTDPSHPDYDLSTASPYRHVEPQPRFWFTRRWVMIIVAFIVVTAMLLPYVRIF